jgi:hypothetical protein
VALGLLFLKLSPEPFKQRHARLQGESRAIAEDRDQFIAENAFSIPGEAKWSQLQP